MSTTQENLTSWAFVLELARGRQPRLRNAGVSWESPDRESSRNFHTKKHATLEMGGANVANTFLRTIWDQTTLPRVVAAQNELLTCFQAT